MAFDKERNGKNGAGGFHPVTVHTAEGDLRPFVLQPLQDTRIYLVVKPDGGLAEGDVLLPRWREWDDADPAQRVLGHARYPDILAAIRGTLHAILGYDRDPLAAGAEIEVMLEARETACAALDYMREVRRLGPQDVAELQQAFGTLIAALDASRDEKKREALVFFEKCLSLRDSLGRLNVGALVLRTSAGLTRVNGRMDDIRSIAPRLALQLMVLEQELSLMYRALMRLQTALTEVLKRSPVFERTVHVPVEAASARRALARMGQLLKLFHAQPFLDLRRVVSGKLEATRVALTEERGEAARELLEAVRQDHVMLMIERVELGAIHRDLSLLTDGKLPPATEQDLVLRLGRFNKRFPEMKGIPDFPYNTASWLAGETSKTLKIGELGGAKKSIAQLVKIFDGAFRTVAR